MNTENDIPGNDLGGIEEDTLIEKCNVMHRRMTMDREFYDFMNDYHQGNQMRPRTPETVDPAVRDLTRRAITNLIRLAVNTPAQLSFAEGFSRIPLNEDDEVITDPPEWVIWNKCGFRAQQTTLFKTTGRYGLGYVSVENLDEEEDTQIKLLSTRNTIAYFRDPVNDRVPVYALTIRDAGGADHDGLAIYYDDQATTYLDYKDGVFSNPRAFQHGLGECPVVRFMCEMDDEGRATGIVEPLIPAQDRVNQTAFDMLITQSFGSFKVRWAAGLVGTPLLDENGEAQEDENGEPLYDNNIEVSQERMLVAEDPAAKFGTFDETPLDGFISAFGDAVKSFAVQGSIPPHALLGSMANLSGETIEAAMGQTNRFTHMLKTSWAESIRQLMRLVRKAEGIDDDDLYTDEVRWRDMGDQSMAQVVDALGKAATMLGVPGEGLWPRIPNATDSELRRWRAMGAVKADEVEDSTDPVASAERETAPALEMDIGGTPNASTGSTASRNTVVNDG